MTLLQARATYAPFEYDRAFDYWLRQQQAHWLHTEVLMASDINDWKMKLSDAERHVIGTILKGFTQSEIFIADYWTGKVQKWFKKPEIQMMAATFGAFESIHAVSYAYLNQSLGLEDFSAFLHEPTAKSKIDRLIGTAGNDPRAMARSLAIFSAFNEGVNLFSSFAVLLNFSRFDKMKGLGQIIAFSIRDESLHSEAGCWLFRTLVDEHPELWDEALQREVHDAAVTTVRLEDDFIDQAFSLGPIEGIAAEDVKAFIRHRTNVKLMELGISPSFYVDVPALERISSWFDVLSSGVTMSDFFAQRVSDYAKGSVVFTMGVFE